MRAYSRDFRWLAAGRGVDAFGNAMHPIGLGFAMLALFDSVTALGLVVGSGALGLLAFLLVGGVVADRVPRGVVMVASNLVAAALQTAVVFIVVAEWQALILLVVLSFLTGAAAGFDHPASTALVPQVLEPEQLAGGNTLLFGIRRSGLIGGAALAGILVAVVGPAAVLALNAASFAAAGLCFAQVKASLPPREESVSPLRDLRDGWTEFRVHRWVVVVVVAFFMINAAWAGGFRILGLAIAEDGMGPARWGIVTASEGVGALAASVFLRGRTFRRPMFVGVVASSMSVWPLVLLAMGGAFVPLLIATFIAGVGELLFATIWDTALQRHIRPDRLARVSSIDMVGSVAAVPIGSYAVGPLAIVFGAPAVVGGAAAALAVASLGALSSRDVRNLR